MSSGWIPLTSVSQNWEPDQSFPGRQTTPGCQLCLSAHARAGTAFSTSQESGANSLRQLSTLLQPQCIPVHFHFSLLAVKGVIAVRQTAAACAESSDSSGWNLSTTTWAIRRVFVSSALAFGLGCWVTQEVGWPLWFPRSVLHSLICLRDCRRCLSSAELDGHNSNSR